MDRFWATAEQEAAMAYGSGSRLQGREQVRAFFTDDWHVGNTARAAMFERREVDFARADGDALDTRHAKPTTA